MMMTLTCCRNCLKMPRSMNFNRFLLLFIAVVIVVVVVVVVVIILVPVLAVVR